MQMWLKYFSLLVFAFTYSSFVHAAAGGTPSAATPDPTEQLFVLAAHCKSNKLLVANFDGSHGVWDIDHNLCVEIVGVLASTGRACPAALVDVGYKVEYGFWQPFGANHIHKINSTLAFTNEACAVY